MRLESNAFAGILAGFVAGNAGKLQERMRDEGWRVKAESESQRAEG
jgi:hypothetical protein